MKHLIVIEKEELNKIKDIIRIVMKDFQRDDLQKRETQISKSQYQDLVDFVNECNRL